MCCKVYTTPGQRTHRRQWAKLFLLQELYLVERKFKVALFRNVCDERCNKLRVADPKREAWGLASGEGHLRRGEQIWDCACVCVCVSIGVWVLGKSYLLRMVSPRSRLLGGVSWHAVSANHAVLRGFVSVGAWIHHPVGPWTRCLTKHTQQIYDVTRDCLWGNPSSHAVSRTHLLQILVEAADLTAAGQGEIWSGGLIDSVWAQHRGEHVSSRACEDTRDQVIMFSFTHSDWNHNCCLLSS